MKQALKLRMFCDLYNIQCLMQTETWEYDIAKSDALNSYRYLYYIPVTYVL